MKVARRWLVPLRYALFQLPGIALVGLGLAGAVRWWDLPESWAWTGLGLWVLKDAAMFPLVRRAYEPSDRGAQALVGSHGVAEELIAPEGWVRIGPELWRAELAPDSGPALQGTPVRVVRIRGLVVVVETDAEAER